MTGNLAFHEATAEVVRQAVPAGVRSEGYYGLPMLKKPLWGWEIALYFFSEGISSGSYLLGTLADVCGGGKYGSLIRDARYLALAALLPCPPLLIADLGRPERFHHMLRVVKRSSPMSLGAWALVGFSQPVALLALAEFTGSRRGRAARSLSLAGLPFALFMLAYPGVLLSTTSIPVWSRTRLLGPLLGCSSMATAAGVLSVAASLRPETEERTLEVVHRIKTFTAVAEAFALSGYVVTAGPAGRPLTGGRYGRMFRWGAFAVGVALPALLGVTRRKPTRTSTAVSGLLSLTGALALKWAVVHAGQESAVNAGDNRRATRADLENPGWMPPTTDRTGVMPARRDPSR